MMYFHLFQLSILTIPAFGCEGQCIVGITRAFVGNYTTPIRNVFAEAATKISELILHSENSMVVPKLMEPLLNSYERTAYDAMEKAIFPSYFHGRCQVNGVDPAGCPNPDCPVVCGTPGSLVHFYHVLQEIAFNTTASNLVDLCAPSNSAYQAFETSVLRELRRPRSRRSLHPVYPGSIRWPHIIQRDSWGALNKGSETGGSSDNVKKQLLIVCQRMGHDLAKQCGGSGLLNCSWEDEMKTFILSFP